MKITHFFTYLISLFFTWTITFILFKEVLLLFMKKESVYPAFIFFGLFIIALVLLSFLLVQFILFLHLMLRLITKRKFDLYTSSYILSCALFLFLYILFTFPFALSLALPIGVFMHFICFSLIKTKSYEKWESKLDDKNSTVE
jgi:hypothetical protein